jgi:hypothetical protein
MAKPKGHRANKANDSFGTVNNQNLYRGKYREEVYQDDDEETMVAEDPSENEATPEGNASFAEPQEGSDTDYKKRYDDLKRHYDSKLDEWKQEREELANAQQAGRDSGLDMSQLPKTPEDLAKFKQDYPDVYAIVETVSSLQAENRLKDLKDEVETLKGREKKMEVQSAYKELLNAHPDFQNLKTDEKFLTWLDEQPSSIADGIYKNNTDSKWAIRVVDLYKADTGVSIKKRRNASDADPAAVVKTSTVKDVVGESSGDKKIWKASEIGRLKPWQFEKLEAEIDSARAEGRIDYSS